MHLLPIVACVALLQGPAAQQEVKPAPPQNETKLGKFLSKSSTRFVAKKVNLPNVKGEEDDTFFFEVVSASSAKDPKVVARGVRMTGYRYSRVGSLSSSTFIDEDELPELVAAIRELVKDATPSSEVDLGDAGKYKVMNVIRIVSREGTEFTFDETLVSGYVISVGSRGYKAGSKEAFTQIANNLERASEILKKL